MMTYTRHVLDKQRFGCDGEGRTEKLKAKITKKRSYASCYTNPFYADNADWTGRGIASRRRRVRACVRACIPTCMHVVGDVVTQQYNKI